jgi:lipopolysaccharide export system protein LptC
MVHYPDDDSTELVAPLVVQTKSDQPRLTMSAERGALSQDGGDVFLLDNVLLMREGSASRPETRVRTSFLHLVRERSLVRTDREVTISEEGRRISGRGLEYDNGTRQLIIHRQVRGYFEPKKKN